MISNDKDLVNTVTLVNAGLQKIQDYLGEENPDIGKISLPKGYIRTVRHFKDRLFYVSNETVKNNLAYALVQSDVYLWLINRTALYGVAKEMTIKFAIALVGSISETLAVMGTHDLIGKRHSFCERCNRMVDLKIVSGTVRDKLHWLWKVRSGVHIYEISYPEYKKYRLTDYNRAVSASRGLMKALESFHRKQNNPLS